MSRIAAYRHESGNRIEVHRADAFALPADALVYGRRSPIDRTLGELPRKPLRPSLAKLLRRRVRSVEGTADLPWKRAFAVDYHPRAGALDGHHTLYLYLDLTNLTWVLRQEFGARSILLLPLSWRNPAVVAHATVRMVLSQSWNDFQMRESCRRHGDGPPAWMPPPCTFLLVDLHDPSPFVEAIEDGNRRFGEWLSHPSLSDPLLTPEDTL
jgi:hypothetical protein